MDNKITNLPKILINFIFPNLLLYQSVSYLSTQISNSVPITGIDNITRIFDTFFVTWLISSLTHNNDKTCYVPQHEFGYTPASRILDSYMNSTF